VVNFGVNLTDKVLARLAALTLSCAVIRDERVVDQAAAFVGFSLSGYNRVAE
jgi:hypothetical protein